MANYVSKIICISIVFCLLFFIGTSAIAKDDVQQVDLTSDKKPTTSIELFVVKKGSLITKDYYEVGDIDDAEFTALVAYDPLNKNEKYKGVEINISDTSRKGRGFLDYDEMVEISKVASYILNLSNELQSQKNNYYTQTSYITKDGVGIGVYKSPIISANAFKRMFGKGDSNPDPVLFISLQSSNSNNSFFFDFDQIAEFKNIIDKSLKLLSDK